MTDPQCGIYDRMRHTISTDRPDQTLLDPTHAAPRVAEPPREGTD